MQFNHVYLNSWNHYFPEQVIDIEAIDKSKATSLGVKTKRSPATDEDSLTMAIEALRPLITGIEKRIDALYVGSESHPYGVKPQVTILQSLLGLKSELLGADIQFACRAGIDSVIIVASLIESNLAKLGAAVGSDIAKGEKGDVLDLTASSASSAWLMSNSKANSIFQVTQAFSYITDTPDFWRHAYSDTPSHAGRFTGEPAYFKHLAAVFDIYNRSAKTNISALKRVAIHAPNSKFPTKLASKLGLSNDVIQEPLSTYHGNPYSANVMIQAELISTNLQKGESLLVLSYGSGAGSVAIELKKL